MGSTARRDVTADLDKQQAGLRLWKSPGRLDAAWMQQVNFFGGARRAREREAAVRISKGAVGPLDAPQKQSESRHRGAIGMRLPIFWGHIPERKLSFTVLMVFSFFVGSADVPSRSQRLNQRREPSSVRRPTSPTTLFPTPQLFSKVPTAAISGLSQQTTTGSFHSTMSNPVYPITLKSAPRDLQTGSRQP